MSTVSVVITTYKGSKYIMEQLESIRIQEMIPDEVWILDDKSPDDTATLIIEYIKSNELTNWHFIQNETNIGWKKNFKKGFELCTGDYIFPCDQDDIWHKDKIRRMVEVMQSKPSIKLLVSNYKMFASNGGDVEAWYQNDAKGQKDDGTVEKVEFSAKWAYIVRPGCSFCFSKDFYELIKPDWVDTWPHDAQLYRMANLVGELYVYNAKLMDYRRHGDNETAKVDKSHQNRVNDIDYYIEFHFKYLNWAKQHRNLVTQNNIDILEHCIRALQLRRKCIHDKRVYLWPVIVFKYGDTMKSWKGCLVDLKCALGR